MNQTETSFKGWGLLSKYRVELMGFSTIWIILFHGYRNNMIFPGKLNILNFIFSKGDCGVEIFLLLSGLGLYYSFSKNPDLSCFYKNRIKRVILPYLLVSGGFWVGQDLINLSQKYLCLCEKYYSLLLLEKRIYQTLVFCTSYSPLSHFSYSILLYLWKTGTFKKTSASSLWHFNHTRFVFKPLCPLYF